MIHVLATPQELLIDKHQFPLVGSPTITAGLYRHFSSTPVMWKYLQKLAEQAGI